MLALFNSAADAVAFAVDYHRALAALGLPFKARAGVHIGTFTLRESSVVDIAVGARQVQVGGLAVPIAARVMAIALGGQTLITGDAHRALHNCALRVQAQGHWR